MSDFILDDATRKSLLGLMPFTQNGTIDFTPSQFDCFPDNVKPIFKQRSFSREEATIARKTISVTDNPNYDKDIRELARKTIVGWNKIFDLSVSKEIEFKAESDTDKSAAKEIFDLIPILIVSKILNNALVISGIIGQEKTGLKSLPESTPVQ